MRERQIEDLLFDLDYSEEETDAFMDVIAYAKACQSNNNIDNLKKYIAETIDKLITNDSQIR